jgi:membrane-associated phospholipid phosphatase
MITNWVWENDLILLFQDAGDWLTPLMKIFTWLGYPQAYMIIIALVYWAFNRKLGLRMALFLPLLASLNSILKPAFHSPRPFWIDQRIIAIHPADGFGMPSGHAQSSTVWLLAGAYIRNYWFWTIAIILVFGVGLSRAYLGEHFPMQIITGWLIGIAIIVLFIRSERSISEWIKKQKLVHQMSFIVGCTLLLIVTGSVFMLSLNHWDMPSEWIRNASVYLPIEKASLESYSFASVSGNAGGFLGVAMGAILIMRKGKFNVNGIWWIRLLRIIIGLSCMAIVYAGLDAIKPDRTYVIAYASWRFTGYYFISFSAVYLIPLLLMKLRLLEMKT